MPGPIRSASSISPSPALHLPPATPRSQQGHHPIDSTPTVPYAAAPNPVPSLAYWATSRQLTGPCPPHWPCQSPSILLTHTCPITLLFKALGGSQCLWRKGQLISPYSRPHPLSACLGPLHPLSPHYFLPLVVAHPHTTPEVGSFLKTSSASTESPVCCLKYGFNQFC